MARGQASPVGAVRQAQNGYVYIKQAGDRGWVLKHWLVWEETHGRRINPATEQVRFLDGDKTNFEPQNIIVVPKGTSGIRRQIARLDAQISELLARKEYYVKELANQTKEK